LGLIYGGAVGAKCWFVVGSDGNARHALAEAAEPDLAATDALVKRLYPASQVTLLGEGSFEVLNPKDGIVSAAVYPSVTVVADGSFGIDYPSQLPEDVRAVIGRRRLVLHAMHSVVDWFAYAIWEDGVLVRALSLSPDSGIMEDLGGRLHFELPYWSGEHPLYGGQGDYPFVFHPLELAEAALADQFGFVFEGEWRPEHFEPSDKPLWDFQISEGGPAAR
jgi:hypothetical protein